MYKISQWHNCKIFLNLYNKVVIKQAGRTYYILSGSNLDILFLGVFRKGGNMKLATSESATKAKLLQLEEDANDYWEKMKLRRVGMTLVGVNGSGAIETDEELIEEIMELIEETTEAEEPTEETVVGVAAASGELESSADDGVKSNLDKQIQDSLKDKLDEEESAAE